MPGLPGFGSKKQIILKMNNLIISRSQLVEATITGTAYGTQCNFNNVQSISKNNIKLKGIEVFSEEQLAKSPTGLTVVGTTGIPSLTLTLVDKNTKKVIDAIPVYGLIRSNNGGFIYLLNNIEINLTECFVTVNDSTGLTAGESLVINLYYDYI